MSIGKMYNVDCALGTQRNQSTCCWYDVGLNVHAQTKDRSDDRRNSFCEELKTCMCTQSYVDGRIISE
jgi:hypothetical protein